MHGVLLQHLYLCYSSCVQSTQDKHSRQMGRIILPVTLPNVHQTRSTFPFQDVLDFPFLLFPGNVPWMTSFSKQSPLLRMACPKYLNFLVLTVANKLFLAPAFSSTQSFFLVVHGTIVFDGTLSFQLPQFVFRQTYKLYRLVAVKLGLVLTSSQHNWSSSSVHVL